MKNKQMLLFLLWIVTSLLFKTAISQTISNPTYVIAQKASTSAGVYRPDGTLVRTLWSGVTKEAGTYEAKWDGTDDFKQTLPIGDYSIKVVSNNVQYIWQGVVGNTSLNQVGSTVHRSLDPATNMVIVGSNAYYAVGYNEGGSSQAEFALNNPQVKLDPFGNITNQTTDYVCTDGTNVYWTGWDNYSDANSWVYATKVSDNSFVSFSAGVRYKATYGKDFPSVIDYKTIGARPSGIAISGNYLFVSYKSLGYVSVLDKTSGTLVRTLTMTTPTAMAGDGNNIWITTGTNTLQKYPINSDGTLGVSPLSIAGLSSPADVRVNGTMLAVVDAGSSQQIKTFNTGTGASIWTLGQPGGIASSPLVTNDRFAFWKIKEETGIKENYGGIAFAPDGSFWVVDAANRRMMHYDGNRNFIESIIYQGKTYTCYVDPNNHSRVMANLMEFVVDYTSSNIQNAWTPKFNWEGKFKAGYNLQDGVRDITTLSNGRTYGLIIVVASGAFEVVELDPATGLRFTGVLLYDAKKMYPDGSVYNIGGTAVNETQTWTKRTLTGFNGNNPVFSNPVTILTNSVTDMKQPRLSGAKILPWEVTSSNVLVCFRGNKENAEVPGSYHLGGLNPSTGQWIWKTSGSTFDNYAGQFPADGTFDIGNGPPQYLGNVAMAIDKSIIWGYNGEFWKASQTNKWNHYYDNGLFIGQFGVTGPEYNAFPTQFPAMAGNSFAPAIIKENGDYYMYHNDESVHGGIHRWKITGLNTIQEQTIPITSSFVRSDETAVLPGIDLMAGLPYRATLASNTAGWTRTPDLEETRWSAKTNLLTYNERKSPDLYVTYNPSVIGVNTINRTLGTNINLTNWQITGKLTFNASEPNGLDGSGLSQYLNVIDNTGKIIVRFFQAIDYGAGTTTVYANNIPIFAKPIIEWKYMTRDFFPLSINKSGNAITVGYAGQTATVSSVYDAGANMSNPSTMQLYFRNSGGNLYEKFMGISEFRFTSSVTLTTPDAPALAADDAANTLIASSVLGTSEILVSENGGAYVGYAGQINVGNVGRAAGYWKFKIKAATGRNESTVVSSPEFTAITTPDAPVLAADDAANTLIASSVLGTSEILVSENGGAYIAYAGQINVGDVARAAGYWKFKIKASTLRNESAVVSSPTFTVSVKPNITPEAPLVFLDDNANTIYATHPLGDSEILVNGNNTYWVPYTGVISVGNVSQPAGYWQFKVRASAGRNESAVTSSAAFTEVTTPDAPALAADDAANTLIASSVLGTSEILVSENGGAYIAYAGQINVGNVARAAGYWKFKIKAATGRNESTVVSSPEFTAITTPDAPVLAADDAANTLIASSVLGTSEILVSENGGAYIAYAGQINVGDVARAAGYWKFKIKASTLRNESAVVSSPTFTVSVKPNITPEAPLVFLDDNANTIYATHPLGDSEILVNGNNTYWVPYTGVISVGNVSQPAGYWQFKVRASAGRNESAVTSSAAFTEVTTPDAPALAADDAANTLIASSVLGTSEILVSENGGAYVGYAGQINVGNVGRAAGYWKFKIKAATGRNESTVVSSPEFTAITTPDAPVLAADDAANTLIASSVLGTSEILVSENGGAYVAYAGQINVGDVARAAGYWKFKIKASTLRNESAVVSSPTFTVSVKPNITPEAPLVFLDDNANTIYATHPLGDSEILVNGNNTYWVPYTGVISVGNVSQPAGYWQFKVRASAGRNESAVTSSAAFTEVTTPDAPALAADDAANTLIASSVLGTSEILVSENGGAYIAYAGQINVGNVGRAAGYWKFKIKAATGRNESTVVNSPEFTAITTPDAPVLAADDAANTLIASSVLGTSEILVSENGGAYIAYAGQINVGDVARAAGYWKFKIKASTLRNESAVVSSPTFTFSVTPSAPVVNANDGTNRLSASHVLGVSEIVVSENGGPFVAYVGQINVGDVVRAAGYWRFKVKAAQNRNESPVAYSPAFTTKKGTVSTSTFKANISNLSVLASPIDEQESINVFPNPIISTNIYIQSSKLAEGDYAVVLVNSTGQVIFQTSVKHPGGNFKYSIPVSQLLPKGMYILQFSGKELKFTKQLLK